MTLSSKSIPPRVPEGEAMDNQEEFSLEQINKEFKKRMREYIHFVDFIINELHLKSHSRVLEVGPGPAWISIILVKKCPNTDLTGLEISKDMIQIAEQNALNEGLKDKIHFIHGNANDMSIFKDNYFDAVISHDSLHHWEKPIMVLNEIARVIKTDGVLCLGDGRRDIGFSAKLIFNVLKLFLSKKMSYYWKSSIMAGYTPEEARAMLNQTDLKGKCEIIADLFDITIYKKA